MAAAPARGPAAARILPDPPRQTKCRAPTRAQGTQGTVDGVVDEVIYFGDMTYYDVYLGGTDVEVRLSMRNVPGRPILDVGSKVQVAWSPDALVLFR